MRPPDLPGGNLDCNVSIIRYTFASMRPPDLPGGNTCCAIGRAEMAKLQ